MRIALIVLAGALAYANSLSAPFIFDDQATIVDNPHIRELAPSTSLFPRREVPTAGRPVVNFSFAVNYALGGLSVAGYRVVNLGLHLACALVLFGIVRRTLTLHDPPDRPDPRDPPDLAFAVALIWAVHPLNSEVVDYVTQRTESMMALFYLLTLYCAIRGWKAASIASCAIGMACKESMVTAPLVVMLYDRVYLFPSFGRMLRERGGLYVGLASTWLILAALIRSGPRIHSAGFSAGVSAWTYLLNQTAMIARYLRLAVWPRSLVLAYGEPAPLSIADVWPYALVVVALIALTAFALARRPTLGFLGAWFLIALAPTSSIVPIATEVGAERRMYLPMMGAVVLFVVGAQFFVGARLKPSRSNLPRTGARRLQPSVVVVGLVLAPVLITLTAIRNREYRSQLRMAETVLERWPSGYAHAMLGIELASAGRHEEAMRQLRAAVGTFSRARYHLGGELFNAGRLDESLEMLDQFVREQPMLVEVVRARMMLGRIYMAKRRWQDAIEQFTLVRSMTARATADYAAATGMLADTLFGQGKAAEAAVSYRDFLAMHPTEIGPLVNYGICLATIGRPDEAIAVFRRAIELAPTDITARRNLAKALFNEGRIDAAASETAELLQLQPDDAVAHDLLGRALASTGRLVEARAEFERAVQLDAGDAQAREDLELVRRALRAAR